MIEEGDQIEEKYVRLNRVGHLHEVRSRDDHIVVVTCGLYKVRRHVTFYKSIPSDVPICARCAAHGARFTDEITEDSRARVALVE